MSIEEKGKNVVHRTDRPRYILIIVSTEPNNSRYPLFAFMKTATGTFLSISIPVQQALCCWLRSLPYLRATAVPAMMWTGLGLQFCWEELPARGWITTRRLCNQNWFIVAWIAHSLQRCFAEGHNSIRVACALGDCCLHLICLGNFVTSFCWLKRCNTEGIEPALAFIPSCPDKGRYYLQASMFEQK